MTPTAPITAPSPSSGPAPSSTDSSDPARAGAGSGLGFTNNIETAFRQSTNGKVRAKIVPEQILDVPYYVNVVVPTAGGTGAVSKQTHLEADLTRGALEFLMEDTGLKEIEVLGPAETAGGGGGGSGGNGTGGGTPPTTTQAGFFQRNWPWILGGGAVLLVGAQLAARSGRRRLEPPRQPRSRQAGSSQASSDSSTPEDTTSEGPSSEDGTSEEARADRANADRANADRENTDRSNASGDPLSEDEFSEDAMEVVESGEAAIEELEEETEESLPGVLKERGNPSQGGPSSQQQNASGSNDSPDYWIARTTVDKEEMDQGNVHRTSMASNIASLEMEDQRRIASDLAVAPGGRVTVWNNTTDGLKKQKTFRWSPDNGFSPTG